MSSHSNESELKSRGGSFWALVLTSFTVLLGVSLTATVVWAKPSATLCSSAKDRQALEDPANYRPLTDLPRMVEGAQVLLLGEVHRTHYGFRAALMKALGATRKGNACLFVELNREMTLEEHIQNFSQPGFEDVAKHMKRMRTLAREQGLKSFTVDTESSPEDTSVGEINRRDLEMAKEIARLLKKDCDTAIMFVGKAHLVNEKRGRVNLNERLRKLGVTTRSINLQDPDDHRMTRFWGEEHAREVQSWNGICARGKKLPSPSAPQIFLSRKLDPQLVLWPKINERANWGAFDFTLLAKDPDLE